ncbi:MAG: ABC transporter permease [Bryobacteraceae bacterium]
MAVYRRGYQRYQGPLTSHAARVLAFPRLAWRRLMNQRLVLIALIVSLIWPLLCLGYIYLANNLDLLKTMGGAAPVFKIDGQFFLVFMNVQAVFATLLAALAGPGLVAPDIANGALPLYFSRPISRLDYAVARLAVLGGMLSLITWVPGLILILMQCSMTGWGWIRPNWSMAVGLLAGFLLWVLLVSMVALACSAYVRMRLIAGGLVLGFFFVLAGMEQVLNQVLRTNWATLLNPTRSSYYIWSGLLGVEIPEGPGALECALALAVMITLLAWILERKLRPVEVVA